MALGIIADVRVGVLAFAQVAEGGGAPGSRVGLESSQGAQTPVDR